MGKMGGKASKEIQKLETSSNTLENVPTAAKADFRKEFKSFESTFDEISDFEEFELEVSDAEEAQEDLPTYTDIHDTVL